MVKTGKISAHIARSAYQCRRKHGRRLPWDKAEQMLVMLETAPPVDEWCISFQLVHCITLQVVLTATSTARPTAVVRTAPAWCSKSPRNCRHQYIVAHYVAAFNQYF